MAGVGDLWIWGRGQVMKGSVDGLWEVCGSVRRSWEDLWEDCGRIMGGVHMDGPVGDLWICGAGVMEGSVGGMWEVCGTMGLQGRLQQPFSLQPLCRLVSGEPGKRRPGMVWMKLAAITVFLHPLIS